MDLKFYLNKFCKVDNIEYYTLKSLLAIKEKYDEFLDKSEGYDPDFPMSSFGDKQGKKVGGTNIHTIEKGEFEEGDPESIVRLDTNGRQEKPPRPIANMDDYKDKRALSSEERAMKFLKSKNLQ